MPIAHLRSQLVAFLSLSTTVALAGCGDGILPTPDSEIALSPGEVAEVGAAFEEDTDLALGSLFHGGTLRWFDLSLTDMRTFFPPGSRPHLPSPVIACLAISPLPPEDPDNDGVPTVLTATFDSGCSFTNRRTGGARFALTGTLTWEDPFPDTPGYDLDETLDGFGHTFQPSNGAHMVEVTRDGMRNVRHTQTTLTAAEQLTSVRSGTIGAQKSVVTDWVVEFTGDQDIVFRQPLPAGEVTVGGTWVFTNRARTREFEVITLTPLRYDPGCSDKKPIRSFTEGEIHVMLVVNGQPHGTIAVVWEDCGKPRREFTPAH